MRIALLSPIPILLIASARLLVVTNYDTTSAVALASGGGLVETLIGTVIPLLPPYLPVATIFFLVNRNGQLAAISAALTIIISPAYVDIGAGLRSTWDDLKQLWVLLWARDWSALWESQRLVVVVAGIAAILGLIWWVRSLTGWQFVRRLTVVIAVVPIVASGMLFVDAVYRVPFDVNYLSRVARTPWTPAEIVTTRTGQIGVVYVMSISNGWFVVMRNFDRSIEYVKADQVTARRVCAVYDETEPLPLIIPRGARQHTAPPCLPS
ncbi:hypothetical protein [Pseudonocardia sp. KRD291]|uniref:hypothetical protein n=1 Tax=Pseudonocardia sp. KRD291 TaxID=2792007 RepID=UPI001C4A221F|nr:hypothetical protein [Pseudonocardia sp. KRD291]MBW0103661.1 hypothetical protein [Pseudonocardia sp. KRD291]